MRDWMSLVAISAMGVLLLGGCPMPGVDTDFGKSAPPTNIPAGTYRGETTLTIKGYVNGELVKTDTGSQEDDGAIIDGDGRPVNTRTGQAFRVGDVNSFNLADVSITATTTSVTSSGNTVVEHYDVVWIEGDVTLTGTGVDTYIYAGSTIDVRFSFSAGERRPGDDALIAIGFDSTGTLTK